MQCKDVKTERLSTSMEEIKNGHDNNMDFLNREGSLYTVIAPVYQHKTNMGCLLNLRRMMELN